MLIDERIDSMVMRSRRYRISNIRYWKWHGNPGFLCASATVDLSTDIAVGKMVLEASTAECLTSPSEYVRELKVWFLKHKYSDYKIIFEDHTPPREYNPCSEIYL